MPEFKRLVVLHGLENPELEGSRTTNRDSGEGDEDWKSPSTYTPIASMELTSDIKDSSVSTAPLTEFSLQEQQVKEVYSDCPKTFDNNVWDAQTPTRILSRESIVEPIIITAGDFGAGRIFTVSGFDHYSKNTYQEAMATFRYFRFKAIKFRVVTVGSPWLYGYIALTTCPRTGFRATDDNDSDSWLHDYGWMSHHDCVIIDLCSQTEVEMVLDWPFVNQWLDRNKVGGHMDAFKDICSLRVIAGSCYGIDQTTNPSIDLEVFAQFIEPEVAGPMNYFVPQTHVSQMLGQVAAGIATTAGTMAVEHFTKEATKVGNQALEYGTAEARKAMQDKWQAWYASNSSKPAAPASVDSVVSNDGQPSEIIPNIFGSATFSPSRGLLGDGSQCSTHARKHSFANFVSIPSLVSAFAMLKGATVTFSLNPFQRSAVESAATCSRLRYLGQFFRLWRGSLDYTVIMFCSPLISARVKLSVQYVATASTLAGDTLYDNVTIRGTTKRSFNIPWLQTVNYLPTRVLDPDFGDDIVPTMTISVFDTYGADPAVDYPILFLIYERAGPDFVCISQQDPMPNAPDVVKTHVSQMRIADFGGQSNWNSHPSPNLLPAEGPTTFEDLVKRWHDREQNLLPYPQPYTYIASPRRYPLMESVAMLFLYSRGQMKFKIATTVTGPQGKYLLAKLETDKNDVIGGRNDFDKFDDGMAVINYEYTPVMEFTNPWICTTEWYPMQPTSIVGQDPTAYGTFLYGMDYEHGSTLETPTLTLCLASAGDDFCFNFEMPPPFYKVRWYDDSLTESEDRKLHAKRSRMALKVKYKHETVSAARYLRAGKSGRTATGTPHGLAKA